MTAFDGRQGAGAPERGKVLRMFHLGLSRVEDLMIKAASVVIFLLALVGAASVLGRYLFKMPVPDMPTIGEQLMVLIIFFSVGRTQRCKSHVRVDAVVSRLPPPARRVLDVFGLVLGILLFLVLAWQSWKMAVQSWAVRDAASVFPYYPLWPARFLVPIGSLTMVLRMTADLFIPQAESPAS